MARVGVRKEFTESAQGREGFRVRQEGDMGQQRKAAHDRVNTAYPKDGTVHTKAQWQEMVRQGQGAPQSNSSWQTSHKSS